MNPLLISMSLSAALALGACSDTNFSGGITGKTKEKSKVSSEPGISIGYEDGNPQDATDDKDIPDQVGIVDSVGSAISCKGTNLVTNGNFDLGNVSFTTEYGYELGCRVTKGRYTPGDALKYTINEDPGECHDGYAKNVAGNSGKMLVVNLPKAGDGMRNFWCQQLQVKAGITYEMSVRTRTVSLTDQKSRISWTINGADFSKIFDPAPRSWVLFTSKWEATKDETIELCGKNFDQNTESGDLAVDDISFAICR